MVITKGRGCNYNMNANLDKYQQKEVHCSQGSTNWSLGGSEGATTTRMLFKTNIIEKYHIEIRDQQNSDSEEASVLLQPGHQF